MAKIRGTRGDEGVVEVLLDRQVVVVRGVDINTHSSRTILDSRTGRLLLRRSMREQCPKKGLKIYRIY